MKVQRLVLCLALTTCWGCKSEKRETPEASETSVKTTEQIIPTAPKVTSTMSLQNDNGDWIVVQDSGRQWSSKYRNLVVVVNEANDTYQLTVQGKSDTHRLGKKDYGYKICDQDEQTVFKFKTYPDKIKIGQSDDDPHAWSIYFKDTNQYKVKRDDVELGKILFYPDQGQVKAKDAAGNVLCRAQSLGLSYVPVVAFMTELTETERLIVATLLKIMDRQ